MANTLIQIRTSTANATPQTLYIGEPAYSYVSNTLFIGTANGNSVIPIGGQSYIAQQQLIYNTANAAFAAANTSAGASSSGSYANSAFAVANSASIYANAAFAAANSASDTWVRNQANAAFIQANASFVQANTPSYVANSAATYANGAFEAANSAQQNATSASLYANAAFTQANTVNTSSQSAFDKANSANVLAQAAYDAANSAGSSTFTQAAFNKANSANVLAQASYDYANTVNSYAYSANTFLQANDASTLASATSYTNTANTNLKSYVDNTFYPKTGGTVSGSVSITNDLTITGNLTVLGNSTTLNTSSIILNDPLIYLANNNYTSDIVDIGIIGHYNATQNAHTGIIRDPNLKEWIFFKEYTPEVSSNNLINIAHPSFAQANVYSAYFKGNVVANTITVNGTDLAVYTQASYDKANSANVLAQAAYNAANAAGSSAFTQAAFDKANSANVLAQSSYDAANTVQGGLASANANIIYLLGNTSPYNYNTAIGNTVNSISVGGATVQNASVWKTLTIVQVLDSILFPTLGPSYTIPTIVLTANNSGTFEIGQVINQSLTATGSKNDAGAFTQIRINRNTINLTTNNSPTVTSISNIAAQYGFSDPNNQNYSYANTYTDSNTIVSGTTTWTGYGNYGAGLAKLTNKGTTDTNAFAVLSTTNPQSANNAGFASTSTSITGIYPYFWGISSTQPTTASIAAAIQAGTATRVLAVGSGTLTITFAASSQYVWLAVQTGYAAKTTWYNTALNNGSIGSGQFILSPVSQAVTSPSAYWSGVNFNIYISGYATTTSGSIQFS